MNRKTLYTLSIIMFSILVFNACTTKKNTAITRGFHNLTARYNIFFNGNESFKKSVAKLEDNYKDNYTDIIPILIFPDDVMARTMASDMEYSIKKSVKLIKQHSITAKPKHKKKTSKSKIPGLKNRAQANKEFNTQGEFCKWVDNAYLLMGKAHLYKRDFVPAIKSFEIVINDFGKFGLKPEALLWLARTYIEMGDFANASKMIDQIDAEKELPAKFKGTLMLVRANYYFKQKKYEYTIEKLEAALKIIRKKATKARICFILAQLNQRQGNLAKASTYYKRVIELNPPYTMAFTAKINLAGVFSGEGGNDIERQLRKMLNDDKNIDYQDQIYFALANVELKRKNLPEAIVNYKLSARKSVSNDNQKAMSFLSLADIYYNKTEYLLSQAYFDSTMSYLDRNFSDYEKISAKAKMLKLLSDNLVVLQREDSLQKVSQMPEKERFAFIDKLILDVKQADERKKAELQNEEINKSRIYNYGQDQINPSSNPISSPKWYFYNPQSVSFGKAEFTKKWGNRKLEDNWRRKNKAIVIDFASEDENKTEVDKNEKVADNKTREFYLKGLLSNDSLMNRSKDKVVKACYKLSEVYADKLNDYKEAIFYLEKMNTRYPGNKNEASAYYQLYDLNKKLGKTVDSEKYKSLLLSKYPNSSYSKMISNPNYLNELNSNLKQVERVYEQLYAQYKAKNYETVISGSENAEKTYPNNALIPKFLILKAYSEGALGNTEALKITLNKITTQFPESDVAKLAKDMVAAMQRAEERKKEIYKVNPNSEHVYMMIINNPKVDLAQLKFDVQVFTIDNYPNSKLAITIDSIDNKKVIFVKSYASRDISVDFFRKLNENEATTLKLLKKDDYQHFMISTENYGIFLVSKDVERYLAFFVKNY